MSAEADVKPFRIAVPDDVLDDLSKRLRTTRWPITPEGHPWAYGASLAYMRDVATYWSESYDWRRWEAALNTFPQFKARLDGRDLHFIVEQGSGPAPLPLLMTHGWPGSVVEFMEIIEPLAHPERFGGEPRDAFSVVAPSLPGYGFSDAPAAPLSPRAMAGSLRALMQDVLGFDRYVAQGGDWGAVITSWLGIDHPQGLAAVHLNTMGLSPQRTLLEQPADEAETDYLRRSAEKMAREGAYHGIQGTKPQTLGYGLTDSPIGLAAWILEKFHGWSIPGQDDPPPFSLDHLLTNVMLYWLSGINAANWLYCFSMDGTAFVPPPSAKVTAPTAFLLFPNDIAVPPPDRWIDRAYNRVRRRDAPQGGHFPALENGEMLIEDMRDFFRAYR